MGLATGAGLLCPACGADGSIVKDSRPAPLAIRRRRFCEACNARFTTHEMITLDHEHAASSSATVAFIKAINAFRKMPSARYEAVRTLIHNLSGVVDAPEDGAGNGV